MNPLLESKGKKPRGGVVKTCPHCAAEFYVSPSGLHRKFCSRPCKAAAHVKQVTAACAECGKQFTKAQSYRPRYCSNACYRATRKPGTTCLTCGVALTKAVRRFCSPACVQAKRKTGEERPCPICGAAVYVQVSALHKPHYCSRACHNKSMEIEGPGWKYTRTDGYVAVYYPKHPDAAPGSGFILEHRLVAEQKYGRRILPTEHVHHLNGIRDDNRPENLEVRDPSSHARDSVQRGVEKRKNLKAELEEYRRRFGALD